MRRILLVLLAVLALGACTSVQPWERGTLALGPMQVDDDPLHRFERNQEVYREGAAGANGGSAGGGCGCN